MIAPAHLHQVLSHRKRPPLPLQGVNLSDGSEISSPVVVNAAGPWFNKLNESVGVTLSTTALPVRIQVGFERKVNKLHRFKKFYPNPKAIIWP